MDETVIFPSPNWFQVSAFAVSQDGWIAYGGPSKCLCILEPLYHDYPGVIQSSERYRAHVVNRAHCEKIVCVDFSREWPEKKLILTGSADGAVKQWSIACINNIVKIKSTHSHDIHEKEKEEIAGVGYSSESYAISVGVFGSIVKWDLYSNIVTTYGSFLKNFKPNCIACSQYIPLNVAIGTKQGVVLLLDLNGKGKVLYKVRAHDDEIFNISWCPQYEVLIKKYLKEPIKKSKISERLERPEIDKVERDLNESAATKNLPDDSFDETVVEEDDTFDIYKDHEDNEFGHKKFVPEDIVVKVKEEKEADEFLAECLRLKEVILKKKHEESSIANLVEALDKTHVNGESSKSKKPVNVGNVDDVYSVHTHKHLLASIGKFGAIKLWSKTGKQIASCNVTYTLNKNQNIKQKGPNSNTILWYKPDVLLIADGKGQLLECNPLKIDSKNKLKWRTIHALHKRGLYCITSTAPRVQSPEHSADTDKSQDNWKIFTIAQDRNIVCYSLEKREALAVYNTSGGFLYNLQSCPYDAKRIAVSMGDGAVRVWEADTTVEDEGKLQLGKVDTYWQNVQGKVLNVAWHPTKENLLAFSTAESRIGLIDTSGKNEKPAKTLPPAVRGGIYSLCWGDRFNLYVCGGGEVVVYKTDKPDKDPVHVKVELEGVKWRLTSVSWHQRGVFVGSETGAVALLTHQHEHLTHAFVFNKMIHNMEWHPQQTSSSIDESPYKDLIAVSSLDRLYNIVILEYTDSDGPKLNTWKVLSGHENVVLHLAWSPHKEELLLSTSQDATVRVWDIIQGTCISIFGNHIQSSLGATWSAFPQLSTTVFTGGADCCLRVWNYEDHPPEAYNEIKHEVVPRREKKKKPKQEENKAEEEGTNSKAGNVATCIDVSVKSKNPKRYLLPNLQRHINYKTEGKNVQNFRKVARKFIDGAIDESLEVNSEGNESDLNAVEEDECIGMDFTKIFGSTNDVNEVLDMEMHSHLEYNRFEPWVMLSVFRGHIDAMIQCASQRDALCPFIVSLAPCVSFKYWKDVTQLYLAQIDRLAAKKESDKLYENKHYGGVVFRKMALYLSLHDVTRAINTLLDARLFKEAYMLSRARHMDSIAEDILRKWAAESENSGGTELAIICYLALGDANKATSLLAKSNVQEYLLLATELAKVSGQTSFATHIEEKRSQIQSEEPVAEELKPLPSKIDLMTQNIDLNVENEIVSDNEVFEG